MITDSHCHLNDKKFAQDPAFTPAELVKRAEQHGVTHMQTICTKLADFPEIYAISQQFDNVYASVGIHPHHAGEEGATYEQLLALAQKAKVIGIGETGLDYYYDNAPRKVQQDSFRMHIAVARALNKPVIIHNRHSDEDCRAILTEELQKGPLKLLFHCFSADRIMADFAIKHRIYCSASGIITFKNAEEIRQVFATIPPELLLVETDSPYLAPIPYRGKLNEPAYTREVCAKLAALHNISLEEMAGVTTRNFNSLFNLT